MAAIITFIVLIAAAVLIALFIRDVKAAQQRHAQLGDDPSAEQAPAAPQPTSQPLAQPTPRPSTPPREPVDADVLAEHVRQLRRALDDDLLLEDEAIASIVRQSGGNISEEAARQLLSDAEADRDG